MSVTGFCERISTIIWTTTVSVDGYYEKPPFVPCVEIKEVEVRGGGLEGLEVGVEVGGLTKG